MITNSRLHTTLLIFTVFILIFIGLVGCGPSRGDLVMDDLPLDGDDREISLLELTPRAQEAGYLICPNIPSTDEVLPPAPYNEEIGDCALIGQSAEIGRWLRLLEIIAASCHSEREASWADTLAAREDLDSQIDQLQSLISVSPVEFPPTCPSYTEAEDSETTESDAPSTHRYTDWLMTIGESVVKYCTMIDELVEPLWRACDEINFYQECQQPDRRQYHAIVEGKMIAAEIMYDYADSFYTNYLQTYGFANFRAHFNEAYIDCPDSSRHLLPRFTFEEDASCRLGPGDAYDEMIEIRQNQIAMVVGRDLDEPSWWLVLVPSTHAKCWVSVSTGFAEGQLEDVKTEPAQPHNPSLQNP